MELRYLGIKFSIKLEQMITDDVINLMQIIKQQLEIWN